MGLAPFTWMQRVTIVLDVADFGLVRNALDGKYSVETRLSGTFGYLASEDINSSQSPINALMAIMNTPPLMYILSDSSIEAPAPWYLSLGSELSWSSRACTCCAVWDGPCYFERNPGADPRAICMGPWRHSLCAGGAPGHWPQPRQSPPPPTW
ncbi:leucine-rich repeat protein kinase family protein [Actinidia rufa]|uniref:Leucine-rich repeat protein kinase family protein n=1 Tax=Actinidia rufa TaxID=165716 RepID=A0A7J0FT25_9ERIC|nr:leucine-rich repeat protein kinase family protein [Actinidia rufa]